MRRWVLRSLGATLAIMCLVAPASAGGPVVGVDVGATLPIGTFQRAADPGGAIAPFVGYQIGKRFAFTPMVQPALFAFGNDTDREEDVITIFGILGGGRLSWFDERKEIYFSAQGGYYTDVTGPVNDKGEGFNIAGGFNYEFWENTALGAFIRRDQSSMKAARDSNNDLTFLFTGIEFRHRFEAPPPAAVAVAPAPPPAPPPPPPAKRKIVLRGVNFDFDKAVIREDAKPILDAAVATLKEEPAIAVSVEGHTDAVGTDAYNQRLSERRAKAVSDYLSAHGIDASRLSVNGFGESKPVADNDTAAGRAQNRRVELQVGE
jgi:outer membrane protein OmpA-like peptidoglycan-associated protein